MPANIQLQFTIISLKGMFNFYKSDRFNLYDSIIQTRQMGYKFQKRELQIHVGVTLWWSLAAACMMWASLGHWTLRQPQLHRVNGKPSLTHIGPSLEQPDLYWPSWLAPRPRVTPDWPTWVYLHRAAMQGLSFSIPRTSPALLVLLP